MEIFITLTKYNTSQRREEGKQLLVEYNKTSILTYSSRGPPISRVRYKVFLRWIRVLSLSLDKLGGLGPVGISLKRGG